MIVSDAAAITPLVGAVSPDKATGRSNKALPLLRRVVEDASNDDGWAHLSAVGSLLRKRQPDFDPRSYGYAKLMPLIEATGRFRVDKRDSGDGNPTVIHVRNI